jgi:hypothetical protein
MHFYRQIENMTGVTSGVGAACYSGTPMLAPCDFFFFIRLAQSLIFCVALFRPLFLVVFCPFSCDH